MLLLATISCNNSLDKLRAEKISVFMRELGKCSRWESAHGNIRAGDPRDLRLFYLLALLREWQTQSKIKEGASGKTSR
jgi:hypothetical protein